MKTAVTVLQEMMIKLGEVPDYECIAQSGPAHSALFEYRCRAHGVCVVAAARTKREAKQESARLALAALAARGCSLPPEWCSAPAPAAASTAAGPSAAPAVAKAGAAPPPPHAPPPHAPPPREHVALLKELCDEYRLGAIEYSLVGDTGPAHLRHFTMTARVGQHERSATATTKKAARHFAAHQLYQYLREHLARLTRDFVEEDALARAHEKAMERYIPEEVTWRPDLGQKVADYRRGVETHTEPAQQEAARRVMAEADCTGSPEEALQAAAAALGMALEWATLPTTGRGGVPLYVVTLAPGAPPLTLAGRTRAAAAQQALRTLHQQLRHRPTPLPQS